MYLVLLADRLRLESCYAYINYIIIYRIELKFNTYLYVLYAVTLIVEVPTFDSRNLFNGPERFLP